MPPEYARIRRVVRRQPENEIKGESSEDCQTIRHPRFIAAEKRPEEEFNRLIEDAESVGERHEFRVIQLSFEADYQREKSDLIAALQRPEDRICERENFVDNVERTEEDHKIDCTENVKTVLVGENRRRFVKNHRDNFAGSESDSKRKNRLPDPVEHTHDPTAGRTRLDCIRTMNDITGPDGLDNQPKWKLTGTKDELV